MTLRTLMLVGTLAAHVAVAEEFTKPARFLPEGAGEFSAAALQKRLGGDARCPESGSGGEYQPGVKANTPIVHSGAVARAGAGRSRAACDARQWRR